MLNLNKQTMKQDNIKVVLHGNEWFYILKTPTVPRVGDDIWCESLDIDKMILYRPEQEDYVTEEHYMNWAKYYKQCRDQLKCSARFIIQNVAWGTTSEMNREGYTKPMWVCQGDVDDRWDVNMKTGKEEALPEPKNHYHEISEIAKEVKELSKKIDAIQSNQLSSK